MSLLAKTHQWIDFAYDAAMHGMPRAIANDKKRVLTANGAINEIGKVGQALASPLHVAGSIARTGQIEASLRSAYYNKRDGVNVANIAGSAFTGAVGMATLSGLTHDSSGNPDIAGIPGI